MKELPVELWKEIFEHALDDGKLLDPLYDHVPKRRRGFSSGHSQSMSGSRIFDERDVSLEDSDLRTKLAIVRTCLTWRRIGLPYLFRRVTFTSLEQLQRLTALVRGSRYRYVDGPYRIRLLLEDKGTGYGALIRRIESHINFGKDKADPAVYSDTMSDLLVCCPNLRTFINQNLHSGVPTPSPIINALSEISSAPPSYPSPHSSPPTHFLSLTSSYPANSSYPPSTPHPTLLVSRDPTSSKPATLPYRTGDSYSPLERLEWSGQEALTIGDLTYLLRCAPHLRVLVLPPIYLCSTRLSATSATDAIPLVHLESLSLDLTSMHRAYMRYTRRWTLPSLRKMVIQVGPAPWQADLLYLLEAFGERLTSLQLRVPQYTSMLPSDWEAILSLIPKITSLTFNVACMPVLPPPQIRSLENLKTVGLEGCLPDFRPTNEYDRPESDRREQLTEHLSNLMARGKANDKEGCSIEEIRMLDSEFLLLAQSGNTMGWEIPRRKKLTREVSTWKEWHTTLKMAGIRLTNMEGEAVAAFK